MRYPLVVLAGKNAVAFVVFQRVGPRLAPGLSRAFATNLGGLTRSLVVIPVEQRRLAVATQRPVQHRHAAQDCSDQLGPAAHDCALRVVSLARLAEIGRDIPPLGLRRIESGERRVDADDLMALAVALGVSPISLLMPASETGQDQVEATGVNARVEARQLWRWLR